MLRGEDLVANRFAGRRGDLLGARLLSARQAVPPSAARLGRAIGVADRSSAAAKDVRASAVKGAKFAATADVPARKAPAAIALARSDAKRRT